MEKTLAEYKKELESQITSFQNIHYALKSGSWNLQFDAKWNRVSVNWSDTVRRMLGFESVEDFPNTFEAWESRLHPDDKAQTLREYDLTVADKSGRKVFDVEYRLQSKSGEYHWSHASGGLSRRADGSPKSFDGVFINTDEKHAKDEQLRKLLKEAESVKREAELDSEIISAVSRLYFSIFRIDLGKDFYEEISSDSSVHRLTGHEGRAQEKLNEICDTIVQADYREMVRRFFNLSTIVRRMADTYTIDIEYRAVDGNWHEARFIEKKRNQSGQVTHILYVTRNVSKQKQQELEQEHLRVAYQAAEKANEAKTTFLLNMSHDIRTPMNAILGYSQLMKKELTSPKLLHYQKMIEESSDLLLSIINNVLNMARIESGKVELDENYDEAGSISAEVCNAFEGEAKKKGIKLTKTVQVEHSHIMVDKTKMQEVLTNLIGNAIKYTPFGGEVSVNIKEMPYDLEGYVLIQNEISDTGIGMSQEFLPYLFDSFSRERNTTIGKVPGTGLGMSIVKSLIDLMHGTIKVESELGKGSKFTITIPHKLADHNYYEKADTPVAEMPEAEFKGKRILLVEDNDLNAEIAEAILKEMGFDVERAEDGIICVNKLEKDPLGTYDLVLMDIQMPNMDGYKATQIIRRLPDREKAKIPIVAMTANAFAEDRKRALDSGMNEHITKPIDIVKVKDTLRKILC